MVDERWIVGIGIIAVVWVTTFVARAKNEEPFTAQECVQMCAPIEVRQYLPGFCHIDGDEHNVIRCEGQTSTENVVPIFDVCSCGSQIAR